MKNAPILVVDDEKDFRSVLVAGLRQRGARVTEAATVAEAETALPQGPFDLIISDVHLAGNEGLRWTEHLSKLPDAPPILLITGNPELVTAMRAANLPIAGYLTKPIVFSELAGVVEQHLAARRQRQALRHLIAELHAVAAAGLPAELATRLESLAQALAAEAARPARGAAPAETASRRAIEETIAVLEKTRHSFRSTELGRLRRHLLQVLDSGAA